MIGFTFRNTHSSAFNIGARSIDRSLIPELRKNEFIIPGRHGTIDFGLNTYEKRIIQIEIGLVKNGKWEDLRASARDLAKWLSGKGRLIFDDEPDKSYDASVYEYVGIDQINLLPAGAITINFECQPFAESLNYRQANQAEVTTSGFELPLVVEGSSESCCIITIKNLGNTTINRLTISRKAAI